MGDKIRINSKYDIQDNYDPSDSENEYSANDKRLLDKLKKKKQNSESEDEVYGFSDSDNESENNDLGIADSDIEGQEKSDDDLPDPKAWGKQKRSYYATDYVDQDYGGFGDDEEAALMEEEEAKNLQKRLLEQLGEDDFALEFFSNKSKEIESKDVDVIKSDLTVMSKRQKLQILEKESPEISGLIDDFKSKLTVAKDNLQPVLDLVKDGKLPHCPASNFVKTNYDIILNYCTNISYYLLLKSQKINIQNHPVIKKLYQYRQMLNKMEPIYVDVIKPQIDSILQAINNKVALELTELSRDKKSSKKRKNGESGNDAEHKKLKLIETLEKDNGEDTGVSDDENEFEESDDETKDATTKANSESDESGFSDNDDVGKEPMQLENKPSTSSQLSKMDDVVDKRQITYQMAKNKGLTPHRKKEQRNPRVKHKMKFRKAKIRRKGAVREARTEVSRYGGEASGIKANVKKSIKIQ